MFTREDAIKVVAEFFPRTTVIHGKDYMNGGTRTWEVSPESRLDRTIDLCDPIYDGLKKGGSGVDDTLAESFRKSIEHDYKNENGLW